MNRKMYFAIHGWGGAGKTWLAHTLPGPRIVLDAEMGAFDTKDREDRVTNIILWDPLTEPIPEGLQPEDTVVVSIRKSLAKVRAVMTLLEDGNHPFESLIMDSFTEIQDLLKKVVASPGEAYDPNATFDQQAWGRLKNNGGLMLREIRDMTWPDHSKPINAAIVMYSDDEAVPARPLVEGGIRKAMGGWFDMIGYLFTAELPETQEEVRVLQISRNATAMAKCRLHKVKVAYGTHIENPDLAEILNTLNGGNK
jgi:hypothetical protein